MRKGPSLSGKFISGNFEFVSKKLQEHVRSAQAAGNGGALRAAAMVADKYIYNSLAPHVVDRVPVDTGALAISLSDPNAPGAIHSGTIANNQFFIDYGTSMDSDLRYDIYGPGRTGNGPGPYPYYYPAEIEASNHFMAEGVRYFREVLHGSAIGNISKAILNELRKK